MNSRGFTLVELIVVLSIVAILSTIATLNWNRIVMKSAVESQVKTVHADMMTVRLEALYRKQSRSVVVSGSVFSIYSSTVTSVTPLSSKTFKYRFISTPGNAVANKTFTFDTAGLTNSTQDTICVDPFSDTTLYSDANVDSIVISQGRINLGKRNGDCVTTNVTQK